MNGMIGHEELKGSKHAIISVCFDLEQPVALTDFVYSMTGLAEEYREYVSEKHGLSGDDTKIFIKEFRKGSIIAELLPYGTYMMQALHYADNILILDGFINLFRDKFKLMGNKDHIRDQYSKEKLQSFNRTVAAVANDPNGKATISSASYSESRCQTSVHFEFNASEARKVRQIIEGEFEKLNAADTQSKERTLMYFTRVDKNTAKLNKKSGERVIIPDISDKPLPIIFGSKKAEEKIRPEISEAGDNVFKKGFVVDVETQHINTHPVAYRVTLCHDTIDLPDADN